MSRSCSLLRGLSVCGVIVALVAGITTASAGASTFENPSRIEIPSFGPAVPSPSTIEVNGLPPTLASVEVTLNGLTHNDSPDDLDILLVGPGGYRTVLMSDACGFLLLSSADVIFSEAAAAPLPDNPDVPCVGGTYKPSDYEAFPDVFGPSAPDGPHPTTLATFAGAPSNGTWQLFGFDDTGVDFGAIERGWTLRMLPTASCAGLPATAASQVGGPGNDALTGTPGPDVLLGLGGDDVISGLGGNDVICGGDSNDSVDAGPGKDRLLGEGGDDNLKGGSGKDVVSGGPGKDRLAGQGGRDKLKGQGGRDTCIGGGAADTAKGCEKQRSL